MEKVLNYKHTTAFGNRVNDLRTVVNVNRCCIFVAAP